MLLRTCAVAIWTVALLGCVETSDVLPVGRDTYSVSSTADGYRTAASARQSAYRTAQEECSKQGKKFLLVNEQMARTRMGIDTTVDITFRCLPEDDPEYQRPDVRSPPGVVIEDRRR